MQNEKARDPHELKMCLKTENMALNADMMLRASIMRKESRMTMLVDNRDTGVSTE